MLSEQDKQEFQEKLERLRQEQDQTQKKIYSGKKSFSQAGSSAAGKYIGLGLEFALYIFLFVAGGYFLDQKLSTKPWLLLTGLLLGFGLGVYRLVHSANALNEDQQNENKGPR